MVVTLIGTVVVLILGRIVASVVTAVREQKSILSTDGRDVRDVYLGLGIPE